MASIQDSIRLAGSLDHHLACVGAIGWGHIDEVTGDNLMVDGRMRVWAIKIMNDVIMKCSESQLLNHCLQWRTTLVNALQCCNSTRVMKLITVTIMTLVSRAHEVEVKEFTIAHLLSSLMKFNNTEPRLQATVLPCISAIYYHYHSQCKPHRAMFLQWGKEGLMNSDLSLCRESARLLVIVHMSPDHWTSILTSSITMLSNALSHYSHTLTQTTPIPEQLNLDLPTSEPHRTLYILQVITAHCRLLTYLLHTSPTSQLTLPLTTLVGVVSFGLRIDRNNIITMATDSTLLLAILPVVWSSLLTLLTCLITSSQTNILSLTSIIDDIIMKQMSNEGGVVWRDCVMSAVCAWVRVRGEGGRGDVFTSAIIQLLLQTTIKHDHHGLSVLCEVMEHCSITMSTNIIQMIWQKAVDILSKPSTPTLTLIGVKLLQRCVEYSSSTPLSTTIKILQNYTHHSSTEVCNESRRGLSLCNMLLHPLGPPWITGTPPISGINIELPSDESSIVISPHQSAPLGGKIYEKEVPQEIIISDSHRKRRRESNAVTSRVRGHIDSDPMNVDNETEDKLTSVMKNGHTECMIDNTPDHTECNTPDHTECNTPDHTECNTPDRTECNTPDHTECIANKRADTTPGVGDHTADTTPGVGDHTADTTPGVGDHTECIGNKTNTRAGTGDQFKTNQTNATDGMGDNTTPGVGDQSTCSSTLANDKVGEWRSEVSDDSDIGDIIATFCSSPSHSESDDNIV